MENMSRRSFLKTMGTTTAATVLATSGVSAAERFADRKVKKVVAKEEPQKVKLACVGIANRGRQIIGDLERTGLCEIVALCDVDPNSKESQQTIAEHPNAKVFTDFRKLFDEYANEFEAVSIAIPDFSHFPVAMLAISMGKHVYVEKPMARTFYECELMMDIARRHPEVVTQVGNQGHSEGNYFQFKAWKEAGIIKDVTAITAHMNNSRRWHGWDPSIKAYPSEEKPATMDWDTWLGPAHYHDYHHDFHNGQWRCWYEFGMGALGDWGAHLLDTAHEFLELGLPEEVNPLYLKDHNPFFYPMSSTLLFKFPERKGMPAVDVTWYDGLDNLPEVPQGYGESAIDPNVPLVAGQKIKPSALNPGKEIYSKTLTFKGASHGSTLEIIPKEAAQDMAGKLPEVPEAPTNHYENFLLACMGKAKPTSPFSISGPLSQVFCLGVIAQWTGHKLLFDRNTKQITNDTVANQLLWGPLPREGWKQYYEL